MNKKIIITTRIISLVIFIFCITSIINWYLDNKKNDSLLSEIYNNKKYGNSINIENTIIDTDIIDFNNLQKQNSDLIGWLKVNNTNINYPVVKSTNNDYYLNHNFKNDISSAGWIFADCNCLGDGTDKNMTIYGHNRKDKSMFGSLNKILNSEWYENVDNKYILYETKSKTIIYEVFSVYTIKLEDYYINNNFDNDLNYLNFINTLKARSIYNFNVELTGNDNIITLSTCANDNHYRVVLHAKKLNIN